MKWHFQHCNQTIYGIRLYRRGLIRLIFGDKSCLTMTKRLSKRLKVSRSRGRPSSSSLGSVYTSRMRALKRAWQVMTTVAYASATSDKTRGCGFKDSKEVPNRRTTALSSAWTPKSSTTQVPCYIPTLISHSEETCHLLLTLLRLPTAKILSILEDNGH